MKLFYQGKYGICQVVKIKIKIKCFVFRLQLYSQVNDLKGALHPALKVQSPGAEGAAQALYRVVQ